MKYHFEVGKKKNCWKIYPNLGLISGWDFFYSSSSTLIKVNYGRHNKVVITNQFCTYETFFTFIYLAVRCNSSALCCLIYQVTIRVGRAQCFEINKKKSHCWRESSALRLFWRETNNCSSLRYKIRSFGAIFVHCGRKKNVIHIIIQLIQKAELTLN